MKFSRRDFLRTCGIGAAALEVPNIVFAEPDRTYYHTVDNGGNVYVFGLREKLVLTCVVSNSGAYGRDFVRRIENSFGNNYYPLLAVTGGFSQSGKSIGNISVNHERVTSGCWKYQGESIVFDGNGGRPIFDICVTDSDNFDMRRGGYIHLLPAPAEFEGRHVRAGDVCKRIAIGYNEDERRIVIRVGPMNAAGAALLMGQYGCDEAVLSDGGDCCFAHPWYEGARISNGRKIKDVLVFMEHK